MEKPADISSKASIGLVKRIPGGEVHMGSRFHPREVHRLYAWRLRDWARARNGQPVYCFSDGQAAVQERWWTGGPAWLTGHADGGLENWRIPDVERR
jgi:hypothetical protein